VKKTPKKTPKKARHSWKHSEGGRSGTCKVCGLKYKLVKNGASVMLSTRFLVDGEWVAVRSQPSCVKAKTKRKASKAINDATIRADERAKTEAETRLLLDEVATLRAQVDAYAEKLGLRIMSLPLTTQKGGAK